MYGFYVKVISILFIINVKNESKKKLINNQLKKKKQLITKKNKLLISQIVIRELIKIKTLCNFDLIKQKQKINNFRGYFMKYE